MVYLCFTTFRNGKLQILTNIVVYIGVILGIGTASRAIIITIFQKLTYLSTCFVILFILFAQQKILYDINDYQINENKLMKKYKHIIDNSEEGMIIIKQNEQVDYYNETFIKYFQNSIVKENQINESL
jgi:c-di-AMP phosphodiesterase-like protein